ncbi:MAG: GalNAc(5)-diNAcBac-PP-undecaprenol beta-1,3-glucosyltransferase [candidate division WS2 bacterium]|nr:GalNAc(5)-diNAcBac-PP-undecaprenol beta-1,3-glucosyltransferase [Candidatus Psychracetigena formicireducens]
MKNQTERKFTIIIPTRERADTLIYTIASALAQDYTNLVILVSDNASSDNTSALVSKFNDSRIQYINTGKRVSMSHNWEFALDHVTEGWVTVLGDDDAILPGTLTSVNKIIDETGTLAIRSNGCGYSWPSLLGERYGNLTISLKKGYQRLQSKDSLIAVLNGELHYNKLPMLYNGGFVDISLVKKAKSITGDFFLSMNPDVYSAMVFSLLTDEYVYSVEPLAINGASHHSGGTAGFEKIKRKRSYDPAEKFYAEDNIPFHHDLPLLNNQRPVRSIPAIVYEAYLQAAPFHDQKNLTVLAEKQLEVILRNSSPHHDEVRSWGMSFAELHNLRYEEIFNKSASKQKHLRAALKKIMTRLENLAFEVSIYGNKNMPLTDVFQASIVAGTITSIKPGMYNRIINNILVRLRKHL